MQISKKIFKDQRDPVIPAETFVPWAVGSGQLSQPLSWPGFFFAKNSAIFYIFQLKMMDVHELVPLEYTCKKMKSTHDSKIRKNCTHGTHKNEATNVMIFSSIC